MEQKVNNEIAMTGEINLKGEVSEIGGLKEKLNGAKKAGAKHVLIPRDNMNLRLCLLNKHLKEIQKN